MKEINAKIDDLRVKSGVVESQITQLTQEEESLQAQIKELGYNSLEDLVKALDSMDTNLDTRVSTLNADVDKIIKSVEEALNGN